MKNILLTGSGGFIGKNLKNYLGEKYNLLCPRSFELDLTDENAVECFFESNEIDFIIHCGSVGGARGIEDKSTTVEDNLKMVDNILNSKRPEVRVILFGSGAMYDKSRNIHNVKESEIGEVVPSDLYGKSKYLIYEKIKSRADVLMLNIFACYGYGEKENRFPSYAINQVLNGEDILINQNVVFDYLFVEDMARIVEYFIQNRPQDNVINITPTKSSSLLEIAESVREISGASVGIKILMPEMNNEYTGDNSMLKKNFPSLVFTPLEIGLKKLYEYKKNLIKEKIK